MVGGRCSQLSTNFFLRTYRKFPGFPAWILDISREIPSLPFPDWKIIPYGAWKKCSGQNKWLSYPSLRTPPKNRKLSDSVRTHWNLEQFRYPNSGPQMTFWSFMVTGEPLHISPGWAYNISDKPNTQVGSLKAPSSASTAVGWDFTSPG